MAVTTLHANLNSRGMNYSLDRLKPSKIDGKHWKYTLTPSDKSLFRSIEIYRAPPSRIWAHHLAPVRLAFRALSNGKAEGWLTASAMLAAFTLVLLVKTYYQCLKTFFRKVTSIAVG